MLINGKPPVASGTVVSANGDKLQISVAGHIFNIEFVDDGGAYRGEVVDSTARFYNANDPLGAYITFAGALNGVPLQVKIATSFIPSGAGQGVRLVHYTVVEG